MAIGQSVQQRHLTGGIQIRQLSGKELRGRRTLGRRTDLLQSGGAKFSIRIANQFDDHLDQFVGRVVGRPNDERRNDGQQAHDDETLKHSRRHAAISSKDA
jgi:hypothetical protein